MPRPCSAWCAFWILCLMPRTMGRTCTTGTTRRLSCSTPMPGNSSYKTFQKAGATLLLSNRHKVCWTLSVLTGRFSFPKCTQHSKPSVRPKTLCRGLWQRKKHYKAKIPCLPQRSVWVKQQKPRPKQWRLCYRWVHRFAYKARATTVWTAGQMPWQWH